MTSISEEGELAAEWPGPAVEAAGRDHRSRDDLAATVLACLPDPLVVADADGRIVLLNAAAERLYGSTTDTLAGRPAAEALVHRPADGANGDVWPTAWSAEGAADGSLLARHRRADGTAFDAEVRFAALRAADGAHLGTVAVVRDATVRPAVEPWPAVPHAMVDAAVEAIVGIDANDIVRLWSRGAERLFGWAAEDVVGLPVARLVADDHPRLRPREVGAEVRAGRVVHLETVVQRRRGGQVPVHLTATPVIGRDGCYQGAVVTGLDISARRQAEREAGHARWLLQRVLDHAPNVVCVKDRAGRVRLINRRGAESLGLSPDEVIGRSDLDVLGGELAALSRTEDRRVMEDGEPLTVAKHLPGPDGETRTWLVTKFPIVDADGSVDGVGLVASDVSELRRGEADSARLAALVRAAPDAIITDAADGTIATWNPSAERMFGLGAAEAVGRTLARVVPESEMDAYRELRASVLSGETVTRRMAGRRADGSLFPVQMSAASLTAHDGSSIGTVTIVRDITELAEAELELRKRASRLERSNADLEEFAYAASHDLQEPLRSIQMGAGAVMRAAAARLEDEERQLLAHIDAAATRMSAQVNALMELAQVALGQPDAEAAPVELALGDALDALRAAIREADAELEVQRPLPCAAMPRAELALVLQNLIANAIKYRRQDRRLRVTVSATRDAGFVDIRVADNGIGLTDAERAQIFGIFARAHPGLPGTGFGLALCRRILERRSGSISVASAGRGRGSQFTVRLPGA